MLFGAFTLVTGPLWARKAWGVWWVWDARLTSSLMLFMIFVAYLLLRKYGGPGSDKLGAGMALFGMANVPFIYVSVNVWRTLHPPTSVVPTLPIDMGIPLWYLLDGVHAAVPRRCCACAPRSNTSARASKRSILPRTKRDAIARVLVLWSLLIAGRRRAAGVARSSRSRRPEFVPVDEAPPGEQIPGDAAARRRLRLRLGRRARLRLVDRAAPADRSKRSSPISNRGSG